MDVILSENNIIKLIDKIIVYHYGELLDFTDFKLMFYFFKKSLIDEFFNDKNTIDVSMMMLGDSSPFEVNRFGTIFVNDIEFFNLVRSVLGINDNVTGEVLLNYFKHKFNIDLKRIVYH